MKGFLKWSGVGSGICLVLALIAGYLYLDGKRAIRSGDLHLEGLESPVTVRFDTWGIPHISAGTDRDAYYALGYLHAQDRLFQMDLLRRVSTGRLAEIFGPDLADTDRFFRTLRLRQFGEEYAARLKSRTPATEVCDAYLRGINFYLLTRPAPVEFDILRIPKTRFTFADLISMAGFMTHSFATGFKADPLATYIVDVLGPGYAADFHEHLSGITAPDLNPSTHAHLTALTARILALEDLGLVSDAAAGSNAWAILGNYTASGSPILAGDPHMDVSCPSVWYEAHLTTPDMDLYGHFLAGLPFALLGINQHLAWTITMFKNDDLDLYAETVHPDNPDRIWENDRWTTLTQEQEIIRVRGADPISLTVRRSGHGPVITDIFATLDRFSRPVTARWSFHDLSNRLLEGFYELGRLESVLQAPGALEKIHSPGLNIVMADTQGNIGWWAVGRLPIRPDHVTPLVIQEGANPANDYLGYLPFSANPSAINPDAGILISANHDPGDTGSGPIPGYYHGPGRARRIDALLNLEEKKWTPDDMRSIQLDTVVRDYLHIKNRQVALLEAVPDIHTTQLSMMVLDLYRKWEGDHPADAIGPCIFHTLQHHLCRLVFLDDLGETYYQAFLGTHFPDSVISRLLDRESSPWWDNRHTPETETPSGILTAAWHLTLDTLREHGGPHPLEWRWEDFLILEHVHALGRKKPLNRLFNIGPFPMGGSRDALNYQSAGISAPPFRIRVGPSTRRIIDLSDPTISLGILPTGQSGYFLDPHFQDQAPLYIQGRHRAQIMEPGEIAKATRTRLNLHP